jgi:hypothetical protein
MSIRPRVTQPAEQALYARWLARGTRLSLVAMVLGYVTYVMGWLPAAMPPGEVARRWGLSAADFVAASGVGAGWGWVWRLPDAQSLALGGVALLAACSLPALVGLVQAFRARDDQRCAMLAAAQAAVIVLAASGLVAFGH